MSIFFCEDWAFENNINDWSHPQKGRCLACEILSGRTAVDCVDCENWGYYCDDCDKCFKCEHLPRQNVKKDGGT